jgi:hypothetical protein
MRSLGAEKLAVFLPSMFFPFLCLESHSAFSQTYSGDQVIDGTRVHTEVYEDQGYAIFRNSCGSQRISQRDLQGGAKPYNIIPCPRPRSTPRSDNMPPARNTPPAGRAPTAPSGPRQWAAVAGGIQEGFLGLGPARVSAGYGTGSSQNAASNNAVRACQRNGISCKVVETWNSGCYYITTGGGDRVAWGAGPTAQRAYDSCSKHNGVNCDTKTIGGCFP